MKRWIVCDIDGSLMPPSAGPYVSKEVAQRLIELQEKGNHVVLNSARIFQGVYPLAKQIEMDRFGGYLISCNGCQIYDMKEGKILFEQTLKKDQVEWFWNYVGSLGLGVGFSQPEAFITNQMEKGFQLDQKNCDIDYIVTGHPEKYLQDAVLKCAIASKMENLSSNFDKIQEEAKKHTDFMVIPSTPFLYDVIHEQASKQDALEKLLEHLNISWEQVSAIGDGISDVESIRKAGLGCTLENGKEECKEVADLIVPSCDEDGCLVWLDQLLRGA